jgi:hypothetical protein
MMVATPTASYKYVLLLFELQVLCGYEVVLLHACIQWGSLTQDAISTGVQLCSSVFSVFSPCPPATWVVICKIGYLDCKTFWELWEVMILSRVWPELCVYNPFISNLCLPMSWEPDYACTFLQVDGEPWKQSVPSLSSKDPLIVRTWCWDSV